MVLRWMGSNLWYWRWPWDNKTTCRSSNQASEWGIKGDLFDFKHGMGCCGYIKPYGFHKMVPKKRRNIQWMADLTGWNFLFYAKSQRQQIRTCYNKVWRRPSLNNVGRQWWKETTKGISPFCNIRGTEATIYMDSLKKTSPGLMSPDFCNKSQIVGQEYDLWIFPVLWQQFRQLLA